MIGMETILSIIKIVWDCLKIILNLKYLFYIVLNYIYRPKLEIKLKESNIVFKSTKNVESHLSYICLQILNRSGSTLKIQPKFIQINNERYQTIVHSDINFNKMRPESQNRWESCDNKIYNIFLKDGVTISQNGFSFDFVSHEELILPLSFINGMALTGYKTNPLVFSPKSKIIITLKANGKEYDYAIHRIKAYEQYLNYIPFKIKEIVGLTIKSPN